MQYKFHKHKDKNSNVFGYLHPEISKHKKLKTKIAHVISVAVDGDISWEHANKVIKMLQDENKNKIKKVSKQKKSYKKT